MTNVMHQLRSTIAGVVLAAEESSAARKAIEFDLPESTLGWLLLIVGPMLLVVWLVVFNLLDTRSLWQRSRGFLLATGWLALLRIGVVVGIVVIAINPQERTRTTSYRRSRIAMLIDTSLSMRYPARESTTGAESAGDSRAEAIADLLTQSAMLDRLRKQHDVSIYSFDTSRSSQPLAVLYEESTTISSQGDGNETGSPVSNVPNPESISWRELLQPQGIETRLGESLLEAIRELNGRTLSAIVVLSDGGSNAGVEPSTANEAARNAKPPVRLLTAGVGSTRQAVNLQITSVQAPTDVHIGDAYDFSAFVQGQGLEGRSVEVELFMKPEGSDERPVSVTSTDEFPNPREITLREDGIPVEVNYQQRPTVAGNFEYFVKTKIKADISELSDEDNERRKTIRISDRKTRVLLMAGGPMRDYRFVRNMLYRHKGIDVDVWLQSVDPSTAARVSQESNNLLIEFPTSAAELFEYDVVIAFDPDWNELSSEQLKQMNDWVGIHAGGLLLVAGDVYTPELAGGTDEMDLIRELYPVFLNSYLLDFQFDNSARQAWPIRWTEEGTNAGFLQLSEDPAAAAGTWKEFTGVYRCYPTGGARAGATVYGLFSDPRTQTEYGQPILLATQFYGAGRTMYLGSSEIWRLRMLSDKHYDRFWIKAIREVGQGRLQRGNTRGMLLLDRNQYVLGQTVRLRASLLTPRLEPFLDESVKAEVFAPGGKPLIPLRAMLRDKNRPGQYAGDFRAALPGTYRIEVPIPESKEVLTGKIDVVLPNLESDDPRQNVKLLTDLTRDTGGRYLLLDDLAVLFEETETLQRSVAEATQNDDQTRVDELTLQVTAAEKKLDKELSSLLPNRGEEFLVDERLRTLWDRTWLLYLLVGLLSLEWLTRKLLKLA